MTLDPLARRVPHLGEHEAADAAPAQDFTVREISRRLREWNHYGCCERVSAGARI